MTEIGFGATREGGAQIEAEGWSAGGLEGYQGRFNSTVSNYRATRLYNGDFILLPHDMWDADGEGDEAVYPGDDGNWSSTEHFYAQRTADFKDNKHAR